MSFFEINLPRCMRQYCCDAVYGIPERVTPFFLPSQELDVPGIGDLAVLKREGPEIAPGWPQHGEPVQSHLTPSEGHEAKVVRCENRTRSSKLHKQTNKQTNKQFRPLRLKEPKNLLHVAVKQSY